jgi:hypothetical protein
MRSLALALSVSLVCSLSTGCFSKSSSTESSSSSNNDDSDRKRDRPSEPNNIPKFDKTTTEPVLLRYRLKAGQDLAMVVDLDMNTKINQGAQEMKIKQTMRIEASGVVKSVDSEGKMFLDVKITRLTMKVTGGPKNVDFDTDKPSDDPNLQALGAMINVEIPCKVTPLGKMEETDLEPLRLAARKANNAAFAKVIEDTTHKMFDGTFIQLSEKPVKEGDTYKAGTIAESNMKISTSYKIRSVAGDKKQAVLQPVCTLEMDANAFPGAEATVKSQRLSGWLLFDVEKGLPTMGEMNINILLDVKAQRETVKVEITGKSKVTAKLVAHERQPVRDPEREQERRPR